MKRLVRKAMTQTLYHGTTMNRFKEIVNVGQIMPNELKGGGLHDSTVAEYAEANNMSQSDAYDYIMKNYQGCVFLATTSEIASTYIKYLGDDSGGVIIEVSLPENALLPDDTDFPNATRWQDTADYGQVKILGPVTDDYFKSVTFIFDSNHIYETSYWNWEAELEEQRAKDRAAFQERLKKNKEKLKQMYPEMYQDE